jgi:hypothetical protein
VLAASNLIPLGFLIGALAWALHIALDRALGYGLRTRDGFQRLQGARAGQRGLDAFRPRR